MNTWTVSVTEAAKEQSMNFVLKFSPQVKCRHVRMWNEAVLHVIDLSVMPWNTNSTLSSLTLSPLLPLYGGLK